LVHNPELAKVAGPLGAHFHAGRYSLAERESAVASSPASLIRPIRPARMSGEREQVVYEMATALANVRWVPRGLYDRAVKALDHIGITDVITFMGHYSSVAMTLAFCDVPAGATGTGR
jgi:4-carboxymuconolactone decarboxylase